MWKKERSPFFDGPIEDRESFFRGLKALADKNGLVFDTVHAVYTTGFVGGEDDFNDYLLDINRELIRWAGLLECPYIVIHPIFRGYQGRLSEQEEFDLNIKVYCSFIPAMKQYGVKVLLENMWDDYKGKIYGACCSDMNQSVALIDELNGIAGGEWFGFCYDSGHATIIGANHRKNIALLGSRLKALHLHEVDGIHDSHTCPYLGVTDWADVFGALKDNHYQGNINFEAENAWETYPKAVYPEAISLLGAIARYLKDTYL